MSNILDGKNLSNELTNRLKLEIQNNNMVSEYPPHLVAILLGDDGPSQVYIKKKEEACKKVGIKFTLIKLSTQTTGKDLLIKIREINNDPTIHACIVQLPLPKHIDTDVITYELSPIKDVDGFHPSNIGNMVLDLDTLLPATPFGIKLLLDHYRIFTEGKHVVILGKSMIVGRPLMNLLSSETGCRATVTCCDKYTHNLDQITKMADILVVATGKHNLINSPEQIKNQAVIIDVGIHRIPDSNRKSGYRLEGDVNFDAVKDKCSYITPVPGGVGPMTVISLLLNTWKAYQYQNDMQKY